MSADPAELSVYDASQVLINGIDGVAKVTVADPTIVSAGGLLASGSSATFMVTAIAGGSTTIVVSDSAGAKLSIPVSVEFCEPPSPELSLLGEHLRTPAPAVSEPPGVETPEPDPYTVLYVALPSSSEFPASTISNFSVQIVGPGDEVVEGSNFQPASLAEEYTGYAPPTAPPGALEFFSSAAALKTGSSYKVQLVGQRCVPPQFIGSFFT